MSDISPNTKRSLFAEGAVWMRRLLSPARPPTPDNQVIRDEIFRRFPDPPELTPPMIRRGTEGTTIIELVRSTLHNPMSMFGHEVPAGYHEYLRLWRDDAGAIHLSTAKDL